MNDILEEYNVRILRDKKTGIIKREEWHLGGQLHRSDGPAMVSYNAETRKPAEETWYDMGQVHREGGPAVVYYDPDTGKKSSESWGIFDKEHRVGAPAYIEYNVDGSILREEWKIMGVLDREDGPAIKMVDPETKMVLAEEWHRNGQVHRTDGPAIIIRDAQSGKITEQSYFFAGMQQEDGFSSPEVN